MVEHQQALPYFDDQLHQKFLVTKKSMNGRITKITDFDRERSTDVLRSTDFASKGLFKDTTTGGTKS